MQPNNYQEPESQSGFASGFLLGLVVGGAGGYFLTTDKGRELLKNLTSQLGDKLEGLEGNDSVKELLAKVKDLQAEKDGVIESAREKVNEVATKVVEATTPPKPPKRRFFSGGSILK